MDEAAVKAARAAVKTQPILWSNFIELITRALSFVVTDAESRRLAESANEFHRRLKQLSSQNLQADAVAGRGGSGGRKRVVFSLTPSPAPEDGTTASTSPTVVNDDLDGAGELLGEDELLYNAAAGPFCEHKGKTCSQNAIRGFLKAFFAGVAVKYAIEVIPALLTGKAAKNPSIFRKALGKDTVTFGAFLSALIGVYKAVLCTMRRNRMISASSSGDGLNSFVAGVAAGTVAMLVETNQSRRLTVSLYMLTRALQFGTVWTFKNWRASRQEAKITAAEKESAAKHGGQVALTESEEVAAVSKQDTLDKVLATLDKNGGALVFIVACIQIIYDVVLEQSVLPPAYVRFVVDYSRIPDDYGKDGVNFLFTVGKLIREEIMGKTNPADIIIPDSMTTKQFFESHNTIKHLAKYVPDGIKHDYIICAMEHPNQTNCFHANASRWVRSLPGIFKLYGALNVLMMLFNLKRAARDPAGTALHLLKATSRSTLFFSLVVCACFNVLCASRRTIGYDAFPAFLLNGLIAGSYIFIEPSSRRTELGMYMLLRAIESQWDLGIKKGWWRAVKGGQLVYSALSVGVLMSLYQHDPSSIRSGYLSVMTRLFGHN